MLNIQKTISYQWFLLSWMDTRCVDFLRMQCLYQRMYGCFSGNRAVDGYMDILITDSTGILT